MLRMTFISIDLSAFLVGELLSRTQSLVFSPACAHHQIDKHHINRWNQNSGLMDKSLCMRVNARKFKHIT